MDIVIDQQVQQQSTDIVEMNAAVNVEPEIASTCSSSICSSTSTSTALDDISLTPHSAPIQPTNVTFPKRSYTDRGRSFNPSWFSQYNWLEYFVKRDAAFCFPCRWFGASGIGRSRPEKTFTITGFRDWKHATGNKGVLFLSQ
uniref:TTF-type domain-containing protein n=1 Tax=Amphimedon queenslandica TaxID=400682 RepID=A0A1X7UEZ8_AMPQE